MKIKHLFIYFSILLLSACTQKGQIEDVTTGLYEQGGMSYLDKEMKVPAKIYFGYDEYVLSAESEATLELQASWLEENPTKFVLIEGHCDERGTREYNLALGERRSNSTKSYLESLGIAPDRIGTITFGKERPDVEGAYETAWSKNRRSVTTMDVDRN